ncbi:MAG: glycosyltransferase, partial [Bacteroidota bacterium]
MKKVLIIANDFPPLISIGGQRPYSWYKYLPQFGFQVTVVTRHWDTSFFTPEEYIKAANQRVSSQSDGLNRVIRVPYCLNLRDKFFVRYGVARLVILRKFLSLFYSLAEHFLFFFDSKRNIYYSSLKELSDGQYDVIIATGEPFLLFRYAHLLSKRFHIPWIADYRDTWTSNQGNYKLSVLRKFQFLFFKRLERRYLSNVHTITTASPDYAFQLKRIFASKWVETIYNGYDNVANKLVEKIAPDPNVFYITYAGTIYPHQNLEMFLKGVAGFLSTTAVSDENFSIRFYGVTKEEVLRRTVDWEILKPFISCHEKLPYQEIVKRFRESRILLLLSSPGANWLNAKLFDYMSAKRAILLVENDYGIMERLIKENGSGYI